LIAACNDKASTAVPVRRGDPNHNAPVKKEKSGVITGKFKNLHMPIDCQKCSADFDSSLQALDDNYSGFSRLRNQISQIAIGDGDVTFDAKNQFLILPYPCTDQMITDFFSIQSRVNSIESLIKINLSFSKDIFKTNVIQKTLMVASQNKLRLRPLSAKIDWIDFDGAHPGCSNKTWSIARDDFENHFDQSIAALQKCLGGN
jgi:hypothetical protein